MTADLKQDLDIITRTIATQEIRAHQLLAVQEERKIKLAELEQKCAAEGLDIAHIDDTIANLEILTAQLYEELSENVKKFQQELDKYGENNSKI